MDINESQREAGDVNWSPGTLDLALPAMAGGLCNRTFSNASGAAGLMASFLGGLGEQRRGRWFCHLINSPLFFTKALLAPLPRSCVD